MHLIGLAGYAQAGKDTVGRAFIARGFLRVAFADALKDEVAERLAEPYGVAFEQARAWLDTDGVKEQFRQLMIDHGEARRAEDPDYWIDAARLAWLENGDVVVTDCRYLNELREIIENGGQWLLVIREHPDGTAYPPGNETERQSFGHIEQAGLDGTLAPPAEIFRANKVDHLEYVARKWVAENITAEPANPV